MSDKHSAPLSITKWTILLSVSVVAMFLIVGMGQSSQPGVSAALPNLPTFDSPIGNPVLALDKVVDNPAPQPGDTIDYTLSYANTAPGSQAFNVRIYDFLPAGVQFLSASQPPAVNANGILMFTAPSVGPATTPTDIVVSVRVRSGYEALYNQALVTADGVTPIEDSLLIHTVPATDHLTLTKTGDLAALLGGEIEYTLRCENTGPVAYNNVEVLDVLPTGATLVGASIAPAVTNPPLIKWSVGSLLPGESWEVELTVTAPSSTGRITNTASLNAPTHASVQALFGTTVISEGIIMSVKKTGDITAMAGDELVYTLTYRNKGNQPAAGVVLTDTLPAGVTVTGATPPTSTIDRQWIWEIAALAPGASETIVITTTINDDATGTLYNFAAITAPDAWPGYDTLRTNIQPRNIYLPLVMKIFPAP